MNTQHVTQLDAARLPHSSSSCRAFTLVEMLVVIAMLGLNAAVSMMMQLCNCHQTRLYRVNALHCSRLYLVLASAFLAVGCWNAIGEEYSAKGWLIAVTKTGPDQLEKTNTLGFYVEVINSHYKIRMTDPSNENDYYEYAFADGTMHILHHIQRVPKALGSAPAPKDLQAMYPARVEFRDIPPNDGTRAQFVWLAFASHAFFAALTNGFMAPIWSPEDPALRKQPFSMAMFSERFPSSPHLPTAVHFINDGTYRSYNPVTKTLDVVPLTSPFNRGYTNAVYQVLSATNAGGSVLPERFIFAVYSSPITPGTTPFERVMIYGHTTHASTLAPEQARMGDFRGIASVTDYRLKGVVRAAGQQAEYKYAAYPITNANWLTPDQLASVNRQAQMRMSQKLSITKRGNRRLLIIGSLALLLIPVAWIFWREARRTVRGQ
jgi:prepilin-type N-terminal cleavage/methylation domain-containing protein